MRSLAPAVISLMLGKFLLLNRGAGMLETFFAIMARDELARAGSGRLSGDFFSLVHFQITGPGVSDFLMAHFFFHFHEGDTRTRDDLGVELESAEHACLEAVAGARSMWPELLAVRSDPLRCAFEVCDAEGAVLYWLPFSELLEVCRPAQPPVISAELMRIIEETHKRAATAREEVRTGLADVRRSLIEVSALLAQLERFDRASRTMSAGNLRGGE